MREPVLRPLVLYGAGYPDTVKLVDAINRLEPTWKISGFIDDTPDKLGSSFMGFEILGTGDFLDRPEARDLYVFNNVAASTEARLRVADRIAGTACRMVTLIHPSVDVSYTRIGIDTIVAAGVVLGANAVIGDHCAVRSNAVINHDCVLEDGVFVGPGSVLSGHVTLRSGVYLGAGCVIREHLKIGEHSVVGAGAVVVEDVEPHTVVAGVPAKQLRRAELAEAR